LVRFTVTLAVPIAVALVDSRKWVGSLLVIVIVPFAIGATGSERPRLPTVLLPTIGLFTAIAPGEVTVAAIC
jgi:nitrate/nitrite transporter NarK